MKCLSLKQPWAWAIFHGKDIENRVWSTKFRGELLVHASKSYDLEGYEWIKKNFPALSPLLYREVYDLPRGCIIGKVTMTGCVIHSSSPWFFGPYGFTFENPALFKTPIPHRGKLKIFGVPDEIAKEGL